MRLSQREIILAMVTGTVVLFGMTAILSKSKIDEWKDINKAQNDLVAQIQKNKEIIASRAVWQKKLNELQKSLPEYPADKKMDVQWLSTMDELASKHGVKILKRQAGEEKVVGDVYELPIECKEWEGNLNAIVHFLFDLQSQGAMLDIRQLQMKPKSGDVLRGYFALYCAYAKQGKSASEKKKTNK
jgi:Tfp pilus assembly protein PilO